MSNYSAGYAIAKLQARMDAEALLQIREDAPKCKPGNKPCGERCIPQAQKCKSEGGGGKIAAGVGAAAAIGIGAALLSRRKSGEEGQKALSGSSSGQLALPAAGGTGGSRKALKGSEDKKRLKGGSSSKALPSGGRNPSLPPSGTPAFRTVETKRPAYT